MQVAIALGAAVYLWNAGTGGIEELCSTTEEDDYITSLSWAADGMPTSHPFPQATTQQCYAFWRLSLDVN